MRATSRTLSLALLAALAAGCGGSAGNEAAYDRMGRESAEDVSYTAAAPPPVAASGGGASSAADGSLQLNTAVPTAPGAQPKPAEMPTADEVQVPGTPGGPSATTAATSMIIRTGTASVEVEELEPAIAAAQAMVVRLGGFVANSGIQLGNAEYRQATLELKVPAARFDEVVRGLKPLGKVETVNVTAEDVGEEFVDVTARMGNARRLEARLVELLATRTGRLEDVLQVERELARVREEIERYEGRLRYLRSRVSISTLTLTLHEPASVVGDYGGNPITRAFGRAWRNFVEFTAGLIEAMGWLIPLGLIIAGIVWVLRRVLRGWWRSRRDTTPPPPAAGTGGPV
jgi:hypothetical protein